MKENWWVSKAKELQQAADSHNSKKLFDGLKTIYGPHKKETAALLTADGSKLLVKDDEILNRLAEHFKQVLNRPVGDAISI